MTLIAQNVGTLLQGVEALDRIDDELYAASEHAVSASAVGGHVRHIVDYYARLFEGLPERRVDYDRRERDPAVEASSEIGAERLRALIEPLRALRAADLELELTVKVDVPAGEREVWGRSSLGRELQFLLSHTVHHFALIATILRLNGVEPGPEFGVATSTLRHLEEKGACAP